MAEVQEGRNLSAYINEIQFIASEISYSVDWLNASVKMREQGRFVDAAYIYAPLEAILALFARLSMMFQPDSRGDKERAKMLCDIFSVKPESVLLDRTVRNDIAHYDERLDKELASAKGLIDYGIGPPNLMMASFATNMRNYDPASGEIKILNNSLILSRLLAEVQRVYKISLEIQDKKL